MGGVCDREVGCLASDCQGSSFKSCVLRTVSSHSPHHPQEVLLAHFSLYVHKSGPIYSSYLHTFNRNCLFYILLCTELISAEASRSKNNTTHNPVISTIIGYVSEEDIDRYSLIRFRRVSLHPEIDKSAYRWLNIAPPNVML